MSDPPRLPIKVVVTDLDIGFINLVGLLVKLAFAAIPAIIIIAVIVTAIVMAFGALAGLR
jgi:hypothetical protein